jgi:hypothetical protein
MKSNHLIKQPIFRYINLLNGELGEGAQRNHEKTHRSGNRGNSLDRLEFFAPIQTCGCKEDGKVLRLLSCGIWL